MLRWAEPGNEHPKTRLAERLALPGMHQLLRNVWLEMESGRAGGI